MITERMEKILQLLEISKKASSKELSRSLGVTNRTIKDDIACLTQELDDSGAILSSKRGQGYFFEIQDVLKYQQWKEEHISSNHESLLMTPETNNERVYYLIRKLLMVDYPILIDELAEECYVARQTLTNSLKDVKQILENYDLKLVSTNDGMMIKGSEIRKRCCINDFFFRYAQEEFFAQNNTMFSSPQSQNEIRFVREALLCVLNKHQIRFSDFSIQDMVIHIMISIRRYQFYQYIDLEDISNDTIHETVFYEAASELSDMLEDTFNIELPENEIVYFAMHIQSKAIAMEVSEVEDSNDVEELMYVIFRRIKNRFNISLFFDHELHSFLQLHIVAMVTRIRNQLTMRNPMLHETLSQYQFATEVCMEAVQEIESWYNIQIDENEFAYLVLYFNHALMKKKNKKKRRIVLVCGHGRPEMILLLNQLSEKFNSQIDDIITLDYAELVHFEFESEDLLISTIPLTLQPEVPYVYIKSRVENYFDEISRLLSTSHHHKLRIDQLIPSSHFIENFQAQSKEDVILKIESLIANEAGKTFAKQTMDQLVDAYCEVGNNCVILHSLHDLPFPIILCIHLRNTTLWNRQYVSTVFFINYNTRNFEDMDQTYSMLTEFCSSKHINYKDYHEFLNSFCIHEN